MKRKVKSNAGRKPVSDKKVQVSLYIRQSKIAEFGGIEKMKEALYEVVALRSQNGQESKLMDAKTFFEKVKRMREAQDDEA